MLDVRFLPCSDHSRLWRYHRLWCYLIWKSWIRCLSILVDIIQNCESCLGCKTTQVHWRDPHNIVAGWYGIAITFMNPRTHLVTSGIIYFRFETHHSTYSHKTLQNLSFSILTLLNVGNVVFSKVQNPFWFHEILFRIKLWSQVISPVRVLSHRIFTSKLITIRQIRSLLFYPSSLRRTCIFEFLVVTCLDHS